MSAATYNRRGWRTTAPYHGECTRVTLRLSPEVATKVKQSADHAGLPVNVWIATWLAEITEIHQKGTMT